MGLVTFLYVHVKTVTFLGNPVISILRTRINNFDIEFPMFLIPKTDV